MEIKIERNISCEKSSFKKSLAHLPRTNGTKKESPTFEVRMKGNVEFV